MSPTLGRTSTPCWDFIACNLVLFIISVRQAKTAHRKGAALACGTNCWRQRVAFGRHRNFRLQLAYRDLTEAKSQFIEQIVTQRSWWFEISGSALISR